MNQAQKLDNVLLDQDGHLKLFPYEFYHGLHRDTLRVWCALRARYLLPTIELIDYLNYALGGRTAIEIGAGMGDLGRHLRVPMTDSAIQIENPQVNAYYRAINQCPTDPPADVERIDALSAAAKYRPQVIIGAWVTHKYVGGSQGSVYGTQEELLLDFCDEYWHLGNRMIHYAKPILEIVDYTEITLPGLISRAKSTQDDVFWVWMKEKP